MSYGYNPYKTSSFSRTVANERKMGAYYTDLDHCRDIAKMFKWPEGEEVCVLEPSIGDGSAVITVTGAETNPHVKIYGVELNDAVAKATAQKEHIATVVKADFLDGFTSRREVFSFCFSNPPYISQATNYGNDRQRTEKAFLDKLTTYLKKGGILVWVVPEAEYFSPLHVRLWLSEYETLAVYRFRSSEYERFHQIVAVGCRRRLHHFVQEGETAEFISKWQHDIPDLPDDLTAQIPVLPSQEKAIDLFTTAAFDPDIAKAYFEKNGLGDDMTELFSKSITETAYLPAKLGRPAIPLKKDSEYLLLTSGFTDGLVGDEDAGNLHLMRGVANAVDHQRVLSSGDEDSGEVSSSKLVVTTSTEIEIRIIESNGRIRLIGDEEEKDGKEDIA